MVSDQETMAGVFKSSLPNSGTRIRPLLLSSKYGGEPSGIRIRPFLLASLSRKMRGAVDRLVAIVAAVSSSKSPRSRDALVLKRRKNRKARTTVARALFGFLCLCFCAIVVLKLGSELALLRQGETTSVCVEDVSRSTTATSLEAKRSISSSAISAPATSTSATTSRTDISETTTAATENPLVGFFDFPRRTFAALSEVPLSITIYFDSLSDFLTLPILGAHAIGFIDGPHPLHCPTKFEELFDAVQTGASLYNQAEVGQAKRVLTEYIVKWANTDPLVGMECSLGMAAAYRTLTFAYCANPHTNNRRAYQIGLRILHQAMNWITHVFVKSQHDADMIDGSKWPITIQQINDELTIIQNVLKQDNIPNGHQVHPRLAPGLIQHDFKPTASSWMSSGENRHKIGIVSLCAYPEDHVLPRYAMSNHQIYAKKHGYSYFVETQRVDPKRPHAWGKIALLEQQLLLPDGPEWLLWFDCDTYFMNMTTTIESVLYRYAGIPKDELASREAGAASQANKIATQPRFETKSKIYSVDDVVLDPTVHLIIAEDNAMLNSGTFFVKKSEWSVNLMRQIWGDEKTSPWVDHPWWENAALTWHFLKDIPARFAEDTTLESWPTLSSGGASGIQLGQAGGAGAGKQKVFSELEEEEKNWWISKEMENIYTPEVRIAPQHIFNSYHPVTSRFQHDTWEPGKYVLAFNGVLSSTSPTVIRILYGNYYRQACELNNVQEECIPVVETLPWLQSHESLHKELFKGEDKNA